MRAYCDRCDFDVAANDELDEYWFIDNNRFQDLCAKCRTELKVTGYLDEEAAEYSEYPQSDDDREEDDAPREIEYLQPLVIARSTDV